MTKRKSKRRFIFMSLILILGLVLSFARFNIPFTNSTYNGFMNAIPLGYDLQGGASIVFEAELQEDDLEGDLDLAIKGSMARIELLLKEKSYTEQNVYKDGRNKIVAEIPFLTELSELYTELDRPASFKITTVESADAEAKLSGKHVKNAAFQAQQTQSGLQYGVAILFNDEGTQLFKTLTEEMISSSGTMYIYIGENTEPLTRLSAPEEPIKNGVVFISSSSMTEEYAKNMALEVLSGSFSAKLTTLESKIVSEAEAKNALLFGTIAVFSVLLIALALLIVFSKAFGLIASFASLFTTVLTMFFLQSVPFVLFNTASFAGLGLGIVLHFLSYLMIFSKIKQQNNEGKKLHMSVKNGLKNSIGLVLDLHAVGLIVAVVISIFGGGVAQGFGVALLILSAVSMFVSLVMFRWLLNAYLPLNSTDVKKFNLEKVEVNLYE